LGTPLIGLTGRRVGNEKAVVAVYVTSAFIASLTLIAVFYSEVLWRNVSLVAYGSSLPPEGAYVEANALGMFMAIVFLAIGVMASLFSFREIRRDNITGYYTVLLGMITAMIGLVFSGDLFTLFIFWEAMCICSYALVAFRKEKWEAIEASYKYLIMSSAGSITILFALSFLYGLTGTLNISYLSMSLAGAERNPVMYISLLMLIVGFGLQAGMVPFHMWLPDAHMAAPSSISAVLSGIMVKAGIYGLFKVLFTIFAPLYGSWHVTLAVFAVLTMFVGNLSALLQDDVKRLLAYSTIANTGYILLGIAIGSHRALTGSLFHVLNHAVIKALLFLCAGAFIHETRTRSLRKLVGIRRAMPVTGTVFIIGVLSLASFPFLNIFWSELTIITAGLEADMAWLSFLMIINLIFSAAYCLRLIQTVAIKKETSTSKSAKEASKSMLIPILILGFLSILIGIYPAPFQTLAEAVAQAALNPT
jgi:proton-translocating NADH-quinone oxidoreductase chain N